MSFVLMIREPYAVFPSENLLVSKLSYKLEHLKTASTSTNSGISLSTPITSTLLSL